MSCAVNSEAANEIQNEAVKQEKVKKILVENNLELHISDTQSKENIIFCNRFYDDFKEQKSIRYISPIVRTDDKGHSSLTNYRQCLNTNNSNAPSSYWDLYSVGESNFQLYREDFDKDVLKGEEEIIYGEYSEEIIKTNNYFSGYSVVDLNACTILGRFILKPNYMAHDGGVPENVNALIQYDNNYYTFDLADIRGYKESAPKYSLNVSKIDENMKFIYTCSFD